MDEWASVYGNKVGFVCASCAGPGLARTFGERLKLKYCKNVWLDENNMPTWGQLGCNGFIILDEAHSVKCTATPAFLQVKQEAFAFVERMLFLTGGSSNVSTARSEAGHGDCAKVCFGDGPMHSVKVDILDAEHHKCEEALCVMRERRDAASLAHFLTTLEAHFRNEELLLDEHLYSSNDTTGFSADMSTRRSHFADHANILREIREYSEHATIPESAINTFSNRFYMHTNQYDLNYADRLSESMK